MSDDRSNPDTRPLTQRQEDLLLELFMQLQLEDRRKVIKFCRDLVKAAEGETGEDG